MTVQYYIVCEIDIWYISVPVDKNVQNIELSVETLILKNLQLLVHRSNSEMKSFITKYLFYLLCAWTLAEHSNTLKFFLFYIKIYFLF